MGKQWKQWETIFLGSRLTAGGDCSHETKRCLLLARKAMISLDSILKSRDIILLTKVHIVKAMVFPVREGNGTPLQYSCLEKSHGRRSLVGCSPWGHWVRHDWMTSLSLFTFMHWRRKWQPTPVFLPGESQGRGSLVGCHLWGRTELDMTTAT